MPTQVSLLDGALASAGTLAIQTNGTTSAITISSAQVATFVNNPIMTGLTASRAVFTDGSKGLTSNAITGTGNVVMSASPTLTGTVAGASLQLSSLTSGRVTYAGSSGLLQDSANLLYSGTDLTVYGITVGRGAGAVSTNTAVGASALATGPSGRAVAIGYQALTATTADSNTAVGYQAGYTNTTGYYLVAMGREALYGNTSGISNVGIGDYALRSNTTASDNTAVGYLAGYSNTTGARITAIGSNALYANGGNDNTAVGWSALDANTTGINNTAMSRDALGSNTTGGYNVAIGMNSLASNTTASNNTAVGYQAGYSNTTQGSITAVGYQAGYNNLAGSNVFIGAQAAYSLANVNADRNVVIGVQAGYSANNANASQSVVIGHQAGYTNVGGIANTFVGFQAGYTSSPTAATGINTFVGYRAGYSVTTGVQNTFIGSALVSTGDGAGSLVTTGSKNTIIGAYSGNQGGLDIRTASNYIVLSDGDGNPRTYWNGNGQMYETANASNDIIADFVNSSSSNCYGFRVRYSAVSPNTNSYYFYRAQDSTATRFDVYSNGGIANYQANNSNLSDRREKTNFAPAKSYLETICAIPVQTFKYIDQTDDEPNLGVVAQDVQAVAPELVSESNWGTEEEPKMRLSIYQTDLQYALMKCIQELNAKVEALEAQLKGN